MNKYENWSKERLIARIEKLEACISGCIGTLSEELHDSVNEDAANGDTEVLDILADINTNKVVKSAKLFVKWQRVSVSELQKHLCISFARGGRICDILEHAGVIGKQIDSEPRKVLVKTKEELERILVEKADILVEG